MPFPLQQLIKSVWIVARSSLVSSLRPMTHGPDLWGEDLEGGSRCVDQSGFHKAHGHFMHIVVNIWSSTEISESNCSFLQIERYFEGTCCFKNKKLCT